MYIYKVNRGSYDLYEESLLAHDLKYTQEEFESMCQEVAKNLDPEFYWIEDFANRLIAEYGFKKHEHEYQAEYYLGD
jgi:hypothetical protein